MQDQSIIFFDGHCRLCCRFINYIFKRDLKRQFLYASLQSQTARQFLTKEDIESLKSIVFFQKGKILKESPALQAIMKQLYPRWSLLFSLLPFIFFNALYRLMAKKRYAFFGKKDSLYCAKAEQKKRFLP